MDPERTSLARADHRCVHLDGHNRVADTHRQCKVNLIGSMSSDERAQATAA
jgi:hypothetical protein